MPTELGFVIATRIIDKGNDETALIELGLPQVHPSGVDYYCPYRITGLGNSKVRSAAGVDGFQALFSALGRIYVLLKRSQIAEQKHLSWLDDNEHFGLYDFSEKP